MKRWIMIGGIAAAGLAVAGGGWWWQTRSKTPPVPAAPPGPSPEDLAFAAMKNQAASRKSGDRASAVQTSNGVKDAAKVVMVIGPLVSDPDVQVREAAVRRLGSVNHPQSREWLKQGLQDKDAYVVVHASSSLALLGDASGRDLALKILRDAEEESVIVSVMTMIGALKDVTSKGLVKKYLQRPEPGIQKAAQTAMAALEAHEKERKALEEKVKEAEKWKKEEERKKTEEERRKKEEERAKAQALKEAASKYEAALVFYQKKLKDPSYHGNDAVFHLNDILKKFGQAGLDLSEVKRELVLQEKIRMDKKRQTRPMAGTTLKPGTPQGTLASPPKITITRLTGATANPTSHAGSFTLTGTATAPTSKSGPFKLTAAVASPTSRTRPIALTGAAVVPTGRPSLNAPSGSTLKMAPPVASTFRAAPVRLTGSVTAPTSASGRKPPVKSTLKAGSLSPTSQAKPASNVAHPTSSSKQGPSASKISLEDDVEDGPPIIRMTKPAVSTTVNSSLAGSAMAPARTAPTSGQ